MAQLDARLTDDQEVAGSIPAIRQHSSVEIDHEIFSTVVLSLPLIQEGQLSCQFLAKQSAQVLVIRFNKRTVCPGKCGLVS